MLPLTVPMSGQILNNLCLMKIMFQLKLQVALQMDFLLMDNYGETLYTIGTT